jgi:predicted nucleic acid-binding Zn ribbon protein
MFGLRCDECGEVRWSMFGLLEDVDRTCPACGAQMREERRHPGRSARVGRHDRTERRERPAFEPPAKV